MHFRLRSLCLALVGLAVLPKVAPAQAGGHTVMAVFAHPDDERIVGPLLHRLAREGNRVVWVVSTDGSKGVTDFAKIPAGPELARVRAGESRCAAEKLGIPAPIMLGLEDGGLASFRALTQLRDTLTKLVEKHRPEVIFTIGPEGGTGHPDHRLVGDVITGVVGGLDWPDPPMLYYASIPLERTRTAPKANPWVTPLLERYLPVRVPFTQEDLKAAQASFDCHESQYTKEGREAVDRMLAYDWDGRIWLRPWVASIEPRTELF
jgi:LmbE family N-acetylglucosaminyl deacetylase